MQEEIEANEANDSPANGADPVADDSWVALPTLFKRNSDNSIQVWTMYVCGNKRMTIFGKLNGKKQSSAPTVVNAGKNIGRKNATTAEEQCALEAQSDWEKKLKSGYVLAIDAAKAGEVSELVEGGVWPMLAKVYSKMWHKITWPAAVQPKLDGHRCLGITDTDGKCTLWSRKRHQILSMPHIVEQIEALGTRDMVFDGELYLHSRVGDEVTFDKLSSLIRQSKPMPGGEVMQYHCYDMVYPGGFARRLKMRDSLIPPAGTDPRTPNIIPVLTLIVENEDDVMAAFDQFTRDGYEGCMVRNLDGDYVSHPTHRSDDLQKVKEVDDAEFEIVGVTPGKGKLENCGMFLCRLDNGKTFTAKMIGKLSNLAQFLEHPEAVLGKMLTVKYQGLSADGVPRFPIALRLREDI